MLIKKTTVCFVLALLTAVACQESPQSSFTRKVADYALVEIEKPDLSDMSDNGKEVLNLYRFIADEIDAIYLEQYYGIKDSLMNAISDPFQKTFAEINYGPWDRSTGKSFVDGYNDCPPGAGFYPADMTAQEFAAFVLLKNQARTDELMKYVSRIEEFQQDLPALGPAPDYVPFQD